VGTLVEELNAEDALLVLRVLEEIESPSSPQPPLPLRQAKGERMRRDAMILMRIDAVNGSSAIHVINAGRGEPCVRHHAINECNAPHRGRSRGSPLRLRCCTLIVL
jgi:hypothetical protein